MSSTEHLALVVRTSAGSWGVFRALGGLIVDRLTLSNVGELVQIVEVRKGRSDTQCYTLCERIVIEVNGR